MKRKRQHISGDIYFPVGAIEMLNGSVINTDDTQVKLLNTQNLLKNFNFLAKRDSPDGNDFLQILNG